MDRQVSINNINHRYINNALASNLIPNIPPAGAFSPYPDNNDINFFPPTTADTEFRSTGAVPISISEAQRQTNPMFGL